MKNKILSHSIFALLMIPAVAQARPHVTCVIENDTDLGKTMSYSACKMETPLKLAELIKTYPHLTGPFSVRFWEGSFTRIATVDHKIRVRMYDQCRGYYISDDVSHVLDESTLKFEVENPNLSDAVVASYQLAPLTDNEAILAFQEARKNCETSSEIKRKQN